MFSLFTGLKFHKYLHGYGTPEQQTLHMHKSLHCSTFQNFLTVQAHTHIQSQNFLKTANSSQYPFRQAFLSSVFIQYSKFVDARVKILIIFMFCTDFVDFYGAKLKILNLAHIMSICLYMLCCNIKGKHAELKHYDLNPGHLDGAQAQAWPITTELSNTASNGRTRLLTDSWHPAYTHGKAINMECKVQNFLS